MDNWALWGNKSAESVTDGEVPLSGSGRGCASKPSCLEEVKLTLSGRYLSLANGYSVFKYAVYLFYAAVLLQFSNGVATLWSFRRINNQMFLLLYCYFIIAFYKDWWTCDFLMRCHQTVVIFFLLIYFFLAYRSFFFCFVYLIPVSCDFFKSILIMR